MFGVCRVGRSAGSCILGGGEDSLGDAEWGWRRIVSKQLSVYCPRTWKLICQDVISRVNECHFSYKVIARTGKTREAQEQRHMYIQSKQSETRKPIPSCSAYTRNLQNSIGCLYSSENNNNNRKQRKYFSIQSLAMSGSDRPSLLVILLVLHVNVFIEPSASCNVVESRPLLNF